MQGEKPRCCRTDNDKPMVTLLLILMMACNLWILFYLTWERKEARKADNRRMPEMRIKDRRTRLWARAGSGCRKRSHKLPLRRQMLPRKCKARRWTRRTLPLPTKWKPPAATRWKQSPRAKCPMKNWTRFSGTTASTTRTGSLTGSSHRQAEIPLTKSTVRQGR